MGFWRFGETDVTIYDVREEKSLRAWNFWVNKEGNQTNKMEEMGIVEDEIDVFLGLKQKVVHRLHKRITPPLY